VTGDDRPVSVIRFVFMWASRFTIRLIIRSHGSPFFVVHLEPSCFST